MRNSGIQFKAFQYTFLDVILPEIFYMQYMPKDLEWIICNHDTNLIMISYEILLIDKFWSSQEPIWYYNTNLQSALFLHILLSGLPSWDCGSTHWWFNSLWYWQYSPVKGSTFVGANRGYVHLHLKDLLRYNLTLIHKFPHYNWCTLISIKYLLNYAKSKYYR